MIKIEKNPAFTLQLAVVLLVGLAAGACSAGTDAPGLTPGATPAPDQPGLTEPMPPRDAIPPVELDYLTPSQMEGPYYPLEKPVDRDFDLTRVDGASGSPEGERLRLFGTVYDRGGYPVPGAVVEIWQTDSNGIYLHSGDPDFSDRDPDFQGYGEAVTGAAGRYEFLTLIPGRYEPRPRHIHVKVWLEGRELLTTQFYFPEDDLSGGGGGSGAARNDADPLLVNLTRSPDEDLWLGARDIVLTAAVMDP